MCFQFSWAYSQDGMAGSDGHSTWYILRNYQTVFQNSYVSSNPTSKALGSKSHVSSSIVTVSFITAILVDVGGVSVWCCFAVSWWLTTLCLFSLLICHLYIFFRELSSHSHLSFLSSLPSGLSQDHLSETILVQVTKNCQKIAKLPFFSYLPSPQHTAFLKTFLKKF